MNSKQRVMATLRREPTDRTPIDCWLYQKHFVQKLEQEWGTRDRFLERGLAEASLALCCSGDVRWIETATHWVQHEEPEAVNAAMVDFLKT